MDALKLVALDAKDLEILSAHLQDAVVKVADMTYLPREKRFVALANRFDWSGAIKSETKRKPTFARLRTAIRFERVLAARTTGVDLGNKSAVLSLLAVTCEETSPPAGDLTLLFAGGAAIKLHVECIEAEMRDLGAAWQTKAKPDHERDDEGKGG